MSSRNASTVKERIVYEEKVTLRGEHYYEPYTIGKQLGKGGFATCYEISDSKEGKRNAVKVIHKLTTNQNHTKEENVEKIKEEIAFIASLDHPGIVKHIHNFQDRDNFYIILELCQYGSFNDILKKRKTLTQPETRYFVAQIVEILKYIKEKNIIHRDIKLANFFIDENYRIKLGDFGLATYHNDTIKTRGKMCGTPNYIAPEVIEKRQYSFEVDVWSTGVLIFTLLYGVPPFQTKSIKETYERIKKCMYKFEGYRQANIVCSDEAKDFIRKILVTNPQERLKIEDFMSHPFMNRYKIPKNLESNFPISIPSASFIKSHGKISKKKVGSFIKKERENSISSKQTESTSKIEQRTSIIPTYKNALYPSIKERDEDNCYQTPLKALRESERQQEFNINNEEIVDQQDIQSENCRKKFCSNDYQPVLLTKKKEEKVEKKAIVKEEKETTNILQDKWTRPIFTFKLRQVDRTAQYKQIQKNQIKVIFWQNLTHQYGIVYVLSNHQVCLHFNDTSTLISSIKDSKIHYIQRKQGKITQQIFSFKDSKSNQEEKKAKISQKIQIFTFHHWNLRKTFPLSGNLAQNNEDSAIPLHVKSFKPVNSMAIFKMSDNNLQYFFEDASSVFMSFTTNIISYKCKDKIAVTNFPLTEKKVTMPEFKVKIRQISAFYKRYLPKRATPNASMSGISVWHIKKERPKSVPVKVKRE